MRHPQLKGSKSGDCSCSNRWNSPPFPWELRCFRFVVSSPEIHPFRWNLPVLHLFGLAGRNKKAPVGFPSLQEAFRGRRLGRAQRRELPRRRAIATTEPEGFDPSRKEASLTSTT